MYKMFSCGYFLKMLFYLKMYQNNFFFNIFDISASKWSENTKKNWSKEKN